MTAAWRRGGLVGLAAAAIVACSPVAALRREVSRDFECPARRLEIRSEDALGPDDGPLDRRALRAELRAQRHQDPPAELEVLDFRAEGCGHLDRYVCHRAGPGRPFECGVMIR